jgi:hypothetical protein
VGGSWLPPPRHGPAGFNEGFLDVIARGMNEIQSHCQVYSVAKVPALGRCLPVITPSWMLPWLT